MVGDILQPSHLLFIFLIALLVLGPKRLPDVGRSLGKGLRDFRNALKDNDPREDLAQLNQHAMAPIETTPAEVPEPMATAAVAPEPVGAPTGGPQGSAPEQLESD